VLRPYVTGIDAGGHHAKNVYAFTRKRQHLRCYALHGSTVGQGVPLLSKPTRNNSAKAILYAVGVFTAKEAIMSRLAKIKEPGPGYVHIAGWLEGEHLAQLTAEKLITKIVGGRPKRIWIKTRDRNEFLDLFAYALGMLHVMGTGSIRNLGAHARDLMAKAAEKRDEPPEEPTSSSDEPPKDPPPPPPRRRGGWMRGFGR
jgi:phage terminase large subunit GpA-like protein